MLRQWGSRNACWRIVWRNPFKLDVHFLREKEIQEIAQYVTQMIQQPCYIFFVNRFENIFTNHKLSWHRILALRFAEPTLEKFPGESPPRSPWLRYFKGEMTSNQLLTKLSRYILIWFWSKLQFKGYIYLNLIFISSLRVLSCRPTPFQALDQNSEITK